MVPSSSFRLLPEVLAPGSTRCLRSCCCWVVNPRSSSRQELRICSRLGGGCWVLKRQLKCQGFVHQEASSSSVACRAFQDDDDDDDDDDDASSRCRGHGREVHRLPVLLHERGRKLQYVYSGQRMWTIDPQDESHYSKDGRFQGSPGDWLRECSEKMGRALRRSFVPDQVRPHYLLYLKWTMIHRFLSSINHVHCTQVLLRLPPSLSSTLRIFGRLSFFYCLVVKIQLMMLSQLVFFPLQNLIFTRSSKFAEMTT